MTIVLCPGHGRRGSSSAFSLKCSFLTNVHRWTTGQLCVYVFVDVIISHCSCQCSLTLWSMNCFPVSLFLSSQFGPYIPEHAAAYVHHMVAYLCPLGHSLPSNFSSNCFDIGVDDILNPCWLNEVIGAWAVGGEVSSSLTQARQNSIP